MALPAKRKPLRSGIERAIRREWPRHRKFVRSHECCAQTGECEGPIQFAHVRSGTDGGTGMKPADWWGISLCHWHHFIQHKKGEAAFEKSYGIDMKKLAREFAAKSPDLAMREAMKSEGLK